jgi:hypothetical protein
MRLQRFHLIFVAPLFLLCVTAARADNFDITIINATFSATCIGGSGTCTEVVNGSLDYDSVANTASDLSLQMTGSLNVSFAWGSPACTNANKCLDLGSGSVFYDPGVLAGDNPIEFGPSLSPIFGFDAPTPEPLEGGDDGTTLFIPGICGGDQPNCNATGTFPTGNDYLLASGTYTSVDIGPSAPEPGSAILLTSGFVLLGFQLRRIAVG